MDKQCIAEADRADPYYCQNPMSGGSVLGFFWGCRKTSSRDGMNPRS